MYNFSKEQIARFRLMDFNGFSLSDLFRTYNHWAKEDRNLIKQILNIDFDFYECCY
jgi:hypothetical protein